MRKFLLLFAALVAMSNPASAESHQADPTYNEETLIKFLRLYVLNPDNLKFPVTMDDGTIHTGQEIEKIDGRLYISYLYTANLVAPDNAQEIAAEVVEDTQPILVEFLCSLIEHSDELINGYSEVGLLSRVSDLNGQLLYEIRADKRDCPN